MLRYLDAERTLCHLLLHKFSSADLCPTTLVKSSSSTICWDSNQPLSPLFPWQQCFRYPYILDCLTPPHFHPCLAIYIFYNNYFCLLCFSLLKPLQNSQYVLTCTAQLCLRGTVKMYGGIMSHRVFAKRLNNLTLSYVITRVT